MKFAGRDKNKRPLLRCKCDCGIISTVQWHNIRGGKTKGCRRCQMKSFKYICSARIKSAWYITKDFICDNFLGLCSFLFLLTIGIVGFLTIIMFMLALCWPVALLFIIGSAAYIFYFIKAGLSEQ